MGGTGLAAWRCLVLAALLLPLAPAAAAQGEAEPSPPQETPGRKDPNRPRLVLPGKPVAPGQGSPARQLRLAPEDVPGQLLILANSTKGSPRAQAVLDLFLAVEQETVLGWLAPVLRQNRIGHLNGALQVLRALNSPASAALIRETLLSGSFRGPVREALEICQALDPAGTRPFLIGCLDRPEPELRLHAEALLRGRVGEEDLEPLGALTRSPRSDTRLRALRLVFGVRSPAAAPIFLARLADEATGCAHLAAQGLGRLEILPPEIQELVAAGPGRGRGFAFALLALILKDEAGPARALDPGLAPMLLEGLRGPDPLAGSLCAIALGRISFQSDDLTGLAFQDQEVMDRLIGLLAARIFFPEYGLLLPMAERTAALLSGRTGHLVAREWAQWWQAHREGFAAGRASLPLDRTEQRQRTVVVLADPVESFVLRSRDTAFPLPKEAREIRLAPQEHEALIQALLDQGLLAAAGTLSRAAGLDPARRIRLSLWLAGRELRLEAPVERGGLERFTAEVNRRVDANLWQLYAPAAEAEREPWLEEMGRFFREAGAREREVRLKDLVLARLPGLEGVRRIRALGHLLAIPGIETLLEDRDVELLLAGVGQSQVVDDQVRAVVEVAALGAGPEAWGRILDFLSARFPDGGEHTLQQLLARPGGARLKELFAHRDGRLRALAARQAGRQRDPAWTSTLEGLLRDKEAPVRAAAVWALARLGDLQAVEAIQALARQEESPQVHREILYFAGEVPFAGALEILVRGLSAFDQELRFTAIKALGRTRQPRAADVLAGLVASEPGGRSGRLAAETLTAWGGPSVRAAVRLLLKNPSPAVREEATWILAEVLDGGVVPALIDWLADPAREARARAALVGIACVDFPREPASGFRRWFEQRGTLPDTAWFVEALRSAGYPITFGAPDLLPGAGLAAGGELVALLQGAREWYFRVQAARRLQELAGRDFGTVTAATPRPTLEAIAEAWQGWLSAQETAVR